MKIFQKPLVCFEHQNGASLCGEEHEYTTSSALFFLKKDQAYKAKKSLTLVI